LYQINISNMPKIQITSSEKSEIALARMLELCLKNKIQTTKVERVNLALEWLGDFLQYSDKESIRQILNLENV